MSERERRFRNLDPEAPKEPVGEPRAPVSGRFENLTTELNNDSAIEAPDALRAARALQVQSGLALDEHGDEEQPFIRCGQCETDSNRGAVVCPTCGARLDTPSQRAFNAQFWQRRKAEQAREREAEQAARAKAETASGAMLPAEPRGGDARRQALGESLAQAVREREEPNLLWMDQPHGIRRVPLGWWLLDGVEDSSRKLAIATAGVMTEAFLFARLFAGHPLPRFALIGLAVLAVLTLPLGRFRR